MLTLLGLVGPTDLPSSPSEYLDVLQRRFSEREPLTERFWQSPLQAGSPVLRRDDRAVYVAQRVLNADGAIATSGVSAYTRLGGQSLILNLLAFDGSDVSPPILETVATMARGLKATSP